MGTKSLNAFTVYDTMRSFLNITEEPQSHYDFLESRLVPAITEGHVKSEMFHTAINSCKRESFVTGFNWCVRLCVVQHWLPCESEKAEDFVNRLLEGNLEEIITTIGKSEGVEDFIKVLKAMTDGDILESEFLRTLLDWMIFMFKIGFTTASEFLYDCINEGEQE
jgi:hypothetical protein